MNKTKQFFSLLQFLLRNTPVFWIYPIALSFNLFIRFFTGGFGHTNRDYHPPLDMLLSTQNLFFVGMLGAMLLAPEIMNGTSTAVAMQGNVTEFLLTRAIDRHLLLRARSAFFYLLLTVIPILSLLWFMTAPDLVVWEYDPSTRHQILTHLPNAFSVPESHTNEISLISIPYGNLLVQGWHIWLFLSLGVATQLFLFLILKIKYRKWIFWIVFIGLCFYPLLSIFLRGDHGVAKLSTDESLFFLFSSHQLLCWLLVIAALILGQLWCERRFSRLEQ